MSFFLSFVHFGFQPWLKYRFSGSRFASRLKVLLSKPTSGKVGGSYHEPSFSSMLKYWRLWVITWTS